MNSSAYIYKARVTRVVDGDTVDLIVDLGFFVSLNIRTRLFGIDAFEMRTPEGKIARSFLESLLPVGADVMITTYKKPTDKYGRWLALITLPSGTDVNLLMVTNGHAVVNTYER